MSRHLDTRLSPSATLVESPEVAVSNPTSEKITNEYVRSPEIQRPDTPRLDTPRVVKEHATPSPSKREIGDIAKDSLTRTSAAEEKLHVQIMQLKLKRANKEAPPRVTKGLFRRACSTDLLFLIDTTGSMQGYIDAAKDQIKSIVRDLKATFLNEAEVRIAVVSYKDHGDKDRNIEFLDFVTSPDEVSSFLKDLTATGGRDLPEDVLGGIRQAVNASWRLESRCLIHITDAPPHGGILHDLGRRRDDYFEHGSEPHGLTYSPLLSRLVQLSANYALLRINSSTDRMALMFSKIYASAQADVKLHRTNKYAGEIDVPPPSMWSEERNKHRAVLQFEEMPLGTSFEMLKHLVIRTVTISASLTATRLITSPGYAGGPSGGIREGNKPLANPTDFKDAGSNCRNTKATALEKSTPQWDTLGWLNETLLVEGFCPNVGVHSASTLNDMMSLDENIRLSFLNLTVHKRSLPFAKGSERVASYARTAASTDRFVVKSFQDDGKGLEHIVEDMRAQALCKAFALEFNSLLNSEHMIDFIVTIGLEIKSPGLEKGCISLEPYIEGSYIKYNSNCGWVNEALPKGAYGDAIQAFSHFTFERSWGYFLVVDLQGVGNNLTDPAIQTKDPERFKLNPTNLNEEGFKFFFSTHTCNDICKKLELKSNKKMFETGTWEFREEWPTMDNAVCCSNKLCGKIVFLNSTQKSNQYPGCHWCSTCWPQLQATVVQRRCEEPKHGHSFDLSLFYYESQGQIAPRKCPEHLERDTTAFSAAAVGGSLWNRMRASGSKASLSGRAW